MPGATLLLSVLLVHAPASPAAELLRRFVQAGHETLAASGAVAVDACLTGAQVEVVLLDVGLAPVEVGRVLEVLKRHGVAAPMLWCNVATAAAPGPASLGRPESDEFPMLLRRLQRVLQPDRQALQLEVGELCIDFRRGTAVRAGVPLDLTPTEFAVLGHLAEQRGRAVSRSELLQAIWRITFDTGTNVVDVHIRRLRMKVDDPFGSPLIHTVRGAGYVLDLQPPPGERQHGARA